MARPRIITLCTDFGLRDNFVGQMKGAALAVDPGLRVVDLCHDVPPQNIAAGAFALETGCGAFPPGTVHVAVVDPGVGTTRRAIAVQTEHYTFVAPDNGLLTRVLEVDSPVRAHVLEAAHYRRRAVSATFEGRDVFAPAAAWLARGASLENFGPEAGALVRLTRSRPVLERGASVAVPVLQVDRFGNATLDARGRDLVRLLGPGPAASWPLCVRSRMGEVRRCVRTYGEATDGEPFLLINSAGYLELAIYGESAAVRLGLELDGEVELTLGQERVRG